MKKREKPFQRCECNNTFAREVLNIVQVNVLPNMNRWERKKLRCSLQQFSMKECQNVLSFGRYKSGNLSVIAHEWSLIILSKQRENSIIVNWTLTKNNERSRKEKRSLLVEFFSVYLLRFLALWNTRRRVSRCKSCQRLPVT